MRALAARAWAFRWAVEQVAERAFRRIADELQTHGYPDEFARAALRIADDERRHTSLCADLAVSFGAAGPVVLAERPSLAPIGMKSSDALVYDIVARCCVAESESTATLLTLLPMTAGTARDAVQAIARDEVDHARFGWRTLAYLVEQKRDLSFLGECLPGMLATGGDPLFGPADENASVDASRDGVLPREKQRSVFIEALTDVIFPGFELYGIATDAARAWLTTREATFARTP